MTTKQIQEFLLTYYLLIIESIKTSKLQNPFVLWRWTIQTATNHGVCHCADTCLGVCIGQEDWVKKYCKYKKSYWGQIPGGVHSKKAVISRLMIRVNILQKLLKED